MDGHPSIRPMRLTRVCDGTMESVKYGIRGCLIGKTYEAAVDGRGQLTLTSARLEGIASRATLPSCQGRRNPGTRARPSPIARLDASWFRRGRNDQGFCCRKRVGDDMVAARERSTGGEDYELPVTRSRFACRRLHRSSASRRSHSLHPLVACIALAWVRSDQWQSGAANGVTRSVATLREPALAHLPDRSPQLPESLRPRVACLAAAPSIANAALADLPKHPVDTIVVENCNDGGPSRRRLRVRAIDRPRAVVASNSGDMP